MFQLVRSNYPTSDPCDAKDVKGNLLFRNQCAIRVSYALRKSGVSFATFPRARKCWVHPKEDHVLAARELADWLQRNNVSFIQKVETVTGTEWRKNVVNRTGILCFEDYYPPGQDSGGDHIDLWDGSALTDFGGWLRPRFNIVLPGVWSDFRNAKRTRFFPFS